MNDTHLAPAQWLLVAGGAGAVLGAAVFVFDERMGNRVIRYFMRTVPLRGAPDQRRSVAVPAGQALRAQ